MAGWQRLDVVRLNERLNLDGFPILARSILTLGGGGWAFNDRLVVGGNGHALLGPARVSSSGAFRTRLAGGYGQADVGYRLYSSGLVDVCPLVGFGAGAMTLEIVQQGDATFGQILANPLTMSRLSSWGFLLDFAAAFELRLRRSRDSVRGGPSLGVRVGYAYWPGGWTWDVPGGPQFAVSGAYVRLMVGGWAR